MSIHFDRDRHIHNSTLHLTVTERIAMSFRVATLRRWSLHTVVFNFSSSPSPQFQSHSVLHNFLPWLENKASSTISSSISISNSSYGNSLFASKSIQTGDCILQVPYSVVRFPFQFSIVNCYHIVHHFHNTMIDFAAINSG
jgi:hypothetical protein